MNWRQRWGQVQYEYDASCTEMRVCREVDDLILGERLWFVIIHWMSYMSLKPFVLMTISAELQAISPGLLALRPHYSKAACK